VPFRQVNGNHVLYGAGIEYNLRSGFGARAELMSFDKDVQFAQLGMIYRLGQRERENSVYVDAARAKPVIAAARELPPPAPIVRPVVPSPPPVVVTPRPVVKPRPAITPRPVARLDPCDGFKGVSDDVNFHSDSAKLTERSKLALIHIARTLQRCEQRIVSVSAHTDDIGTTEHNRKLSHTRARARVAALI